MPGEHPYKMFVLQQDGPFDSHSSGFIVNPVSLCSTIALINSLVLWHADIGYKVPIALSHDVALSSTQKGTF